jgi:hypothetical protein
MKNPYVVAMFAASLSGPALHTAQAQPVSRGAFKNMMLAQEEVTATSQ